MNLSKMKKNDLIDELKRRNLPTDGLKDELKSRLETFIQNEDESNDSDVEECDANESDENVKVSEGDAKESEGDTKESEVDAKESEDEAVIKENLDSDGEVRDSDGEIKDSDDEKDITHINKFYSENKEPNVVPEKVIPDPTTELTIEDAIKMKDHSGSNETYSMIVNVTDEDYVESNADLVNSLKEGNEDLDEITNPASRLKSDIDNGDHEVIEVNEDVSIDDNDDNNNSPQNQNEGEKEIFDVDDIDESNRDSEESKVTENKMEVTDIISEIPNETPKGNHIIIVENIARETKAIEVKELFLKYCNVSSAKIAKNNSDINDNCFALITVDTVEDVEKCIENLDKSEFNGSVITVKRKHTELTKVTPVKVASPISSSGSWGRPNKCASRSRSRSKSHSKSVKETKKTNDWGDSEDESNICVPKSHSPTKNTSPSNDDFPKRDYSRQRRDFRGRGGGRRGGYQGDRGRGAYRNDRYDNNGDDYRPRNYGGSRDYERPRYDDRERRGGYGGGYQGNKRDDRDDYHSSYRGRNFDSRRGRDDYRSGRNDYSERPRYYDSERPRYDDRPKYDDSYDKRDRGYKRDLPSFDRSRETEDYRSKREYVPKRPRNDDEFFQSKKRRDEYTPERRERFRMSPKKNFDSGRDYRKPDYRTREPEGSYRAPKSDYIPRKADDFPARRTDYSGGYSPSRRTSRNRDRDSYAQQPGDFGGRSRHYD